jgi:cyclic beta-1,2-glucan synthetase
MSALYHYLVSESDGLIKLLDPPFDKSTPNPGYIAGYLPGIRENGGQYTHGAIWAAMAFAELGENELAWQLFRILNPINHGRSATEINRYKIEPYVIAGDVYSVAPHIGRGGWSWYTGSAGWLYRLIVETLLGAQLEEGNRLRLAPQLPNDWDGFNLDYNYGNTLYKISVKRVEGKGGILLDEIPLEANVISLLDDGQVHQVSLGINILP